MPTLTPYICCKDASNAIEFYKNVFDAVEEKRWNDDDGRVSHAELVFGDSPLFLADEHPEIGVLSPLTIGGSATLLVLEVEDAEATLSRALINGATETRPIADQPYGRNCKLKDPFGHEWMISSPVPL
ncbi:MAG: VOC family protein [Fimbriimonas sp.]